MKKYVYIVPITLVIILLCAAGLYYVSYGRKVANDSIDAIPGTPVTMMTQELAMEPDTSGTQNNPPSPTTPPSPEPVVAKNPTFTIAGISGRKVSGSGSIITTSEGKFIRLEADFTSSTAAPDNRVYLGDANGHQVEIAKLKAPSGAQNFAIPNTIDISKYTHVWIHCKAYNTTYGVGEIIR